MDTSVIKTLLSAYSIGSIAIIKKLSGGVENSNYHILADSNAYVLRVYNTSHSIRGKRTLASVIEELEFVAACRGVVPVAEPIANSIGHKVSQTPDGTMYALFRYIKGESPLALNANIVKAYAKLLDGLYEASSHYIVTSPQLTHDLLSRAEDAAAKYIATTPKVNKVVSQLINYVDAHKPVLSNVAKGYVHGDLKLANTLFENGQLAALLDFDDYRFSYCIEDTTMAIMHNIHNPSQNILRAGHLQLLLDSITNPALLKDIRTGLAVMIRARLLYDICKNASKDPQLVEAILADRYVQEYCEVTLM